jgi:hypothetical protein
MSVSTPNVQGRAAELERRLADAQARLPKHSTPMVLMMGIEELEEALAQARAEALAQSSTQEGNDAASNSRPREV